MRAGGERILRSVKFATDLVFGPDWRASGSSPAPNPLSAAPPPSNQTAKKKGDREGQRNIDSLRGGRLVRLLHATVHGRLEQVGVVLNLGHQGLGFGTQSSCPHDGRRRLLVVCVL